MGIDDVEDQEKECVHYGLMGRRVINEMFPEHCTEENCILSFEYLPLRRKGDVRRLMET
jgi:hypothetical protein